MYINIQSTEGNALIDTPQQTDRSGRMVDGEVAHHPGVPDLVLLSRGVGQRADVRAEHRISLRGRPHPLVEVVEYNGVLGERLEDGGRFHRVLPLQSRVVLKEIVCYFPCRNTLQLSQEHGIHYCVFPLFTCIWSDGV